MQIKVFGCKTNTYFAQKWVNETEIGTREGVLVASCVVTDQAKSRWSKFALKSLKKLKDEEKLYITGCGTFRNGEVDPAFFEQYEELLPYRDRIELLPEEPPAAKILPADLKSKLSRIRTKIAGADMTRKTVVIQTGCDNFCTFCLTVQARGRHSYRPIGDIVTEIAEYVDRGGKEVVLTGINLGAWGTTTSNDFESGRLPELVDAILEQTAIERLRISSLGVEFVSDALLERFQNTRLHAYVHLSVQSGSDAILVTMGRHYTRSRLLDRLHRLRELQRSDGVMIQIGADLIVGFPGETDADFEDTLSLVERFGVTQLHAFPFSAHVDKYHVPAGKFPNQVSESLKHDRLQRLLEAGKIAKADFETRNAGKKFRLLLEGRTDGEKFAGWSENYIALDQDNFVPDPGQVLVRGNVVTGTYRIHN